MKFFLKKHECTQRYTCNSTETLTVHKRDISGRDYFFLEVDL